MADIGFAAKGVGYARVNATADGDNLLVIPAPGPNRAVLVLGYRLTVLGAGDATFRSGAGGTIHMVVTGVAAPGTPIMYPGDNEAGAFLLDTNQGLNINNAAAVDVVGHITYRFVHVNPVG